MLTLSVTSTTLRQGRSVIDWTEEQGGLYRSVGSVIQVAWHRMAEANAGDRTAANLSNGYRSNRIWRLEMRDRTIMRERSTVGSRTVSVRSLLFKVRCNFGCHEIHKQSCPERWCSAKCVQEMQRDTLELLPRKDNLKML
jgi:hypothetical protein